MVPFIYFISSQFYWYGKLYSFALIEIDRNAKLESQCFNENGIKLQFMHTHTQKLYKQYSNEVRPHVYSFDFQDSRFILQLSNIVKRFYLIQIFDKM